MVLVGANWFLEMKKDSEWLEWCKMVCGGERWFWMVQTGLWRRKRALYEVNGAKWFMEVKGGFRWCKLVCGGGKGPYIM